MTPGEPAGIGPDVVLSAAADDEELRNSLVVVADRTLLEERAALLGLALPFCEYAKGDDSLTDALRIMHVPLGEAVTPGVTSPENARYVIDTLEAAVSLCEQGDCAAMVTGPVNKAVINNGGITFSGHTEWLESRTNTSKVVMLLATDGLMVALATTHLPLREVADAITSESLQETISVIHSEMRQRFGVEEPRILVLGLNPHAGEQGHLGNEEIETVAPVLDELRKKGLSLTGPVPADTAFSPKLLAEHDVVLAMYHDQGLPVLKFKGFGAAANVTLGLPIIRTSVDHGTAEPLAGTGEADAGGFRTAVDYARRMAEATC